MVKLNRQRRSGGWRNLATILVGSIGILGLTAWYNNSASFASATETLSSLSALSESIQATNIAENADLNAAEIKTMRNDINQICQAAKTLEDVEAVRNINKVGFTLPVERTEQPRDERAVKRCKHAVLDFGANIGDTSGKLIDAGLHGCKRDDLKTEIPGPIFNTELRQFVDPGAKRRGRNPLVRQFEGLMEGFGPLRGPEDYCYYGVEGNPVFTDRLQSLEDFVMGTRPRPLQLLHFFTKSVGAGEDGMTKLYLDTVNAKQNYWGSSIFKEHQDVRKSAVAQNTTAEMVAADVMGYTIGTLMRQTLIAFDPAATREDKQGGHFILKVDIEGGEYPLVHQAAEDGTLCEYVKMGNQADLYIEFHSQRVTGRNPLFGKLKEDRKKLADCGVTFRNLSANWH
jgi:hypothetical protein